MRRSSAFVACLASLAAGAVPARAASPAALALRALNAQRAANGIPGKVRLDRSLSQGCAAHLRYLARNRIGLEHWFVERPGRPSYSQAGAGKGAWSHFSSENLAVGSGRWSSSRNPWAGAPAHFAALMNPRLTRFGYARRGHLLCSRQDNGRASPVQFVTVSAPRGPHAVVPGGVWGDGAAEQIGLRPGTTTGPPLLLYHFGLGHRLTPSDITLTGPDGPVATGIYGDYRQTLEDGSVVPGHDEYSVLLPRSPLRPNAAYAGSVHWTGEDGAEATQSFEFRTRG